jgi:glycine betaine/choline ABC-type transport system substrate-binding protein
VAVVREQMIQEHPEVAAALATLGGKISDAEMQHMNYAVDGQHRDTQDVVREFLRAKDLVP